MKPLKPSDARCSARYDGDRRLPCISRVAILDHGAVAPCKRTRTEVDRGEFAYMAIGVQCCISLARDRCAGEKPSEERPQLRLLRRDVDRFDRSNRQTCARPCESPVTDAPVAGVRGFSIGRN